MTFMRTLILLMCLCCLSIQSFAEEPDSANALLSELLIWNLSSTDSILVKVIPIGHVFSGDSTHKPISIWNSSNHIFGGSKRLWRYSSTDSALRHRFYLNHDSYSASNTTYDSSIGYANYRVEFWRYEEDEFGNWQFVLKDYLTIDYSDADYPWYPSLFGLTNDFFIYYYSPQNIRVKFANAEGVSIRITETDKEFQIWNQRNSLGGGRFKARNIRWFRTDSNYTEFPIVTSGYTPNGHFLPTSLFVGLRLQHNIQTQDTLPYSDMKLYIKKGAHMLVEPYVSFSMVTPVSGSNELIAEDSSLIDLANNSNIVVYPLNRITLNYGSKMHLSGNSYLLIKNGAFYCNEGSSVTGPGDIIFEKGIHNTCEFDSFTASDSTHIVLDSATLTLPDDFTLHLSGYETALILNPGSKLLFGENSGIVCDSGARLIANNATFASVDSTKKWNGISLNDPSHDTIRNCTIKNAMYGIALSGKYDADESPEPYSSEISGCSFVNTTSYVMNNAVYLEGSAHALVKDNIVSSTNLSIGFTHGIYAEYCPGEMLNFVSNNISNCNNGITVIQSSPYIAFNALNGNSYGESGMFLDNSNGTIKYNVISDFYYSYYSFYSSPDLLKNTFDNSCDDNVYLSSSSVPVMHPLVSGGSTYWFAGDNHITGSPYDAGILFDEDAYPDLNYGYNRFTLSGSSYYISGINPAEGSREFYAVQNYWQDVPPDNSGAGTYVLALGRQHNASGRKS